MGTAAAATSTALPGAFLAATGTAALATERADADRQATVGALAVRGTSQAVSDLATRQAADSAGRLVAATATSAALGAQAAGTAAAVVFANERARSAAAVEAWKAWAWAWTGVGAFMGLALAVIWRIGLLMESASALLLARAKSHAADAAQTAARTALITGAVTLLGNPEYTARDDWRAGLAGFAELAEPLRFNERLMAEAGISYEKSRIFAGILQGGGALRRTNSGSMWAGGWGLAELKSALGRGAFDELFPRRDGELMSPPALA